MRKVIQQCAAAVLIIGALMITHELFQVKSILGINLIIGLIIGSIMSRTKFSFSGNIRGPILNNDYTYSRLLFNMIVIAMFGINWIVIFGSIDGTFDYAAYLSQPTKVSVYFFIAAIIFGMGIALVGSAGSGLIRHSANLKFDYICATIAFFFGALAGVLVREYALQFMVERSLYMPEIFGWPITFIVQAMLLYIFYKAIYRKDI